MTRLISVVSGKGGAGKTTLVANIGSALADMGHDVIVLDANLTTPNLGMHLGIPLYPKTLHDVLKGRAYIGEAIYTHESGLRVIPAGIGINDLRGVDARDLSNVLLDLIGATDIVLIDAAAGLGRETLAALESSDEVLLVTNPDLPSVTDALKAAKLAQNMGTKMLGVVINRVAGKKHEMSRKDIASMLEDIPIIGEIPEHDIIQEAIAYRMPVVLHTPNHPVSHGFRKIAASLVGRRYYEPEKPWYKRLFGFLFK